MYTVNVIENVSFLPNAPKPVGVIVAEEGSPLNDTLAQYKRLKEELRVDTERLSILKARIAEELFDAEKVVDGEGLVICTYKESAAAMRFDAKAFQSDNPELYKQYLKEAMPARMLLVK